MFIKYEEECRYTKNENIKLLSRLKFKKKKTNTFITKYV